MQMQIDIEIVCILISLFYLNFSADSKKSYFPKCHPYMAGCVVVLIFLFTVYHRKQIESFFTTMSIGGGGGGGGDGHQSIITSTSNSTSNAESPKNFTAGLNATQQQHFRTNSGIQQSTGLCNLLITIAISNMLLL